MLRHIVAVVGATATGKTALALQLAQALGGEIINADSRQVYRGMDIGTAKPTTAERAAIPHHLIDVVDPDHTLTLAAYLDLARQVLDEIGNRGAIPLVVGGTGQYVWSLVEGWDVPRVPPDPDLRAGLEALAEREGPQALLEQLRALDPVSAGRIDANNTRRIIRAIEVSRATGRLFSSFRHKTPPKFRATILGLRFDRSALHARIDDRVDAMLAAGLVDEVRALNARGYGCDLPAMTGIGYRQVCDFIAGRRTLEDARTRIKTETHRLARMQHAWFKPDDARVHWLNASSSSLLDDALGAVSADAPGPIS